MQAIAELRGWAPLVALQIEYSLVQRTGERDLIPMARELGLGVTPWSPLAGGVLSGKYSRRDLDEGGAATPSGTRKQVALAHGMLTPRALEIAEAVKQVATEMGKTPSQVALAWTLLNPATTAPLIGARTTKQLEDNLGALAITFTPEQRDVLDRASAIELGFPHDLLRLDLIKEVMSGKLEIATRS
jgi:aryl-alcohol dehydrogenase-like predicted oxidoreductase